jgi:phage protein D/phage baseplate assembly protein gpV
MSVDAAVLAPRFEVRISGITMAADLADQVLSLTVESDLDLAGSFDLTLRNADNVLLDSPLLDIGKTIEIHLGYGNDLVPAFLGEVASIEPSFPQSGPPTIRLAGYDKSYRMRRAQPAPTDYPLMNDSVIAARIALENGLVPVVDPTPGLPEKTTQVESDMAFLKSRGERYFFDVYVEWDRLHFHFPRPQTAAHVLEWGRNLSSFSPRISAAGLAGLQVVRSYSQELAQSIEVAALAVDFDLDNLIERLGSTAQDLLRSLIRKGIRHESIGNPLEAAVLARSLLADLLEGLYEGTGSCMGIPDLTAGNYVSIRGVGKRFGGTYRARKVTHRIGGSGFTTDFAISQRGHTSLMGLLRKQTVEQPSPHRPEKFFGVVLAEVIDNSEIAAAPPKPPLGRVRVKFPAFGNSFVSDWAPCVRPMAGNDRGVYTLPDVGDQVLVAFEHGDLGQPYVLGSLWTAKTAPPSRNLDGLNAEMVIKDKRGSAVTFDSRDGSVTVHAAGNLTLSAQGGIDIQAYSGGSGISLTPTTVDVT